MYIISGFLLGLLGSMHCVGMCGPIVMAVPVHPGRKFFFIISRAVYHLGRLTTYAVIGALFGVIGDKIKMFSFQQYISIALGMIILSAALLSLRKDKPLSRLTVFQGLYAKLRQALGKYIQRKTLSSQYMLGMLNGLLPCGFVYVAVAGAIAFGGVIQSTLFMVSFGVGTSPALILLAWLPRVFKFKRFIEVRRLVPVISILFALLFILRGLNLGIPYVSPKVSRPAAVSVQADTLKNIKAADSTEAGCCCQEK